MTVDRWGVDIAGEPASVEAWNAAWAEFLHFRGDPMATLAHATEHDDAFVMGPVFSALYAILAGSALDAPAVVDNLERATARGASDPHVAALRAAACGDLTSAANAWGRLGAHAEDFAAYRFAHDVFLHVGAAEARMRWAEETLEHRSIDAGRSFIEGMHSFSLNEVGRFAEAEEYGRRALDADPDDLWARHALAHVYEETDDSEAAFELLRDSTEIWADQELLANHVWWHLALRLLAVGDARGALDVFDQTLPLATTAFRLCDHSSLLWRAELAGVDVGDRWGALADRWERIAERHTCGFLDLHATLVYLRRPHHPGASRWFAGLDRRPVGGSELDQIFEQVVQPLVGAFRARASGDHDTFVETLDRLGDTTARIGGSNAQRHLITLTRSAAR